MSRSVRTLRSATVVAAVLALVACKKNDGSGSGLTLSPTSIAFSAAQNGAIPSSQSIQVTMTDSSAAFVVAGYPQGASVPSWMTLSFSGAGTQWSLQATITSTGLTPGTYSATLRVAIARSDESVIAYRDAQVTYTVASALSATPPSLAFTYVTGSAAPAAKTVSLAGSSGLSWTASANQSWVVLGSTSGTAPATLVVSVDPTGLAVGPYTAKVTISAAGKTAVVDVSLSVNAVALQTSASALSFGAVNGAPIPAQSLDVSMNNGTAVSWSATSGAAWLVLSKTSGTTPDTLSVSADPSFGPLASGPYASTITFTASAGGSPLTATVNVDLTLTKAAFSLSPISLVLGGANGRDLSSKSVQLGLNTGANAYAWTATPSNTWMTASSTASTASSTPVTVNVTPDRTGLQGGTRSGSLAFSATVNGDLVSTSLPVTFNLEAHKLLVAYNGVALASMPALSTLTKTVRVTDNLGAATPWSASSDQTWLSVTGSGTAGGDLVLTASPSGRAADSVNLATVTITSSDSTVENAETVRVGFWVGSATPGPLALGTTFAEAVADPIRPYAYVHAGGGSISLYNVHTGASVAISGLPASLGTMAVANDGSRLYVVDKTNSKIVPVNLENLTIGTGWSLASGANSSPRVSYMRTNGVPVLVVTDGVIHGPTGTALATFAQPSQLSSGTLVTTSLQGNAFCAGGCRSLDYSAVGGGTFSMASLMGGFASRDIALNADGSRVYGANGAPYYCTGESTATGAVEVQLGTNLYYPGNIEVGPDGRIYCGRYSTLSTDKDVYVFNSAGTELGSVRLASTSGIGLLDRQLLVSGDGLRVMGLDPALEIVTAP